MQPANLHTAVRENETEGASLCPVAILPSSMLPKLPERELFVKPVVYAGNSFFAQFHADRSLTLEGKFARHAGEKVTIMAQTDGKQPQQIEDVDVVLDNNGGFSISTGHYDQQSLNLYLKTEEAYYCLNVNYNRMNLSKYGQ